MAGKVINKNGPQKKKKKIHVYSKRTKGSETEKSEILALQSKYANVDVHSIATFSDIPLSSKTLKGLKDGGYINPTDIQREAIILALQGNDILGAARTGSGKTIAFLVPLLEILYCKQWTKLDGVGAIVISPTRELSKQIFECLNKIGKKHDFTSGLVIGGQGLREERKIIDQCNIIICTPGRLLDHMDKNYLFMCDNLQLLVLDEADRCLDMGFERDMNAIIDNLPASRQTLLFSATQTTSLKDLARLSLKDPSYVSVDENSKYSTPNSLEQSYVICELQDKLSIIWSFIKNHLKQKIIIFFSSCKAVKYFYEIICQLRPGTSVLALYGTLHQQRRITIYDTFCEKTSAVLFATDLASRGLDFPKVNWVVQFDCPEDTDTYIHRVGRTARFHSGGESLLLLLPSEEGIIEKLEQRKVPINKIEINPNKLINPVRKMEAFLAKNVELKLSAQRAVVSYFKSIFLMKDKSIFNVNALDADAFSKSIGLAMPPRLRFLQRLKKKHHTSKVDEESENDSSDENDMEYSKKADDAIEQWHASGSEDEGGFLQLKRQDHDIELPSQEELEELNLHKSKSKKPVSKVALAKKILQKKIAPNKKIVFDDDGEAVKVGSKEKRSVLAQEYENEVDGGIDIVKAKAVMKEEDKFDRQLFRMKNKIKLKAEKNKLKQKRLDKEKEEQDQFGCSSEDEEPDLSWLPDPDKVYGENSQLSSQELKEFDEDNKNDMKPKQTKKEVTSLKRKKNKVVGSKPKKKKLNVPETKSLSVQEAEELTMMLLNKNR